MRRHPLAAALLLSVLSYPSLAQSPAEHQAHHPDGQETSSTKPNSPSEAPREAPSHGMMGGGMMNMMGDGAAMMKMMEMMRQSAGGMTSMDAIDHVEGRIAFLRTELRITDAQASAWNAFAEALRTNARTLGELRDTTNSQTAAGSSTLVDRLELQEKWLAARLDGIRSTRSALTNLIATLSDEQKKSADELLAPQMGMMPMMSVTGGRTMGMGMGRMQSGKQGQ